MSSTDQFGRKVSLILKAGEAGLDLSEFKIKFKISQTDAITPNQAEITVYNVSDNVARSVGKEFTDVILQAGYENGNFGVIFQGTLKQHKYGKESATDRYLKLYCADGDTFKNFAVSNVSLAAGSSAADRQTALAKQAGVTLDPRAAGGLPGGILPRGRVLFGMASKHFKNQGQSTGVRYSIQNGVLVAVPLEGYLKDQIVVLNAQTGLVGVPEATEDGVEARCLLNPRIKVGTAVRIDSRSVQTTLTDSLTVSPKDQIKYYATVADDGLYRVAVIDYNGDTRGQDWYCDLTLLAINPGVDTFKSVKAYNDAKAKNG